MRQILRAVVPPLFARGLHALRPAWASKEWEHMPDGWRAAARDPKIKGWNEPGVLEAHKAKWPAFVRSLDGTAPFDRWFGSRPGAPRSLVFHNSVMCYAYVLALASRHRTSISMLDWGGGLGEYYLLGKALIPDLEIDYHCKEVPLLADYGRTLLPQAHFYADETCLARRYDFVLVSGSLQFSEDWAPTLRGLAGASAAYLFVTNLPVVQRVRSYVVVQRPYAYGYETEYLCWCLNREEFLANAAAAGLTLLREFALGFRPPVHRAPEEPEYLGYLFQAAVGEEGRICR